GKRQQRGLALQQGVSRRRFQAFLPLRLGRVGTQKRLGRGGKLGVRPNPNRARADRDPDEQHQSCHEPTNARHRIGRSCQNPRMTVEVRDVAPGLWIWRLEHPDWEPHVEWEPLVTSTCVESNGEVALLDALAPPEDAREVWDRLDARPPTLTVVLKP